MANEVLTKEEQELLNDLAKIMAFSPSGFNRKDLTYNGIPLFTIGDSEEGQIYFEDLWRLSRGLANIRKSHAFEWLKNQASLSFFNLPTYQRSSTTNETSNIINALKNFILPDNESLTLQVLLFVPNILINSIRLLLLPNIFSLFEYILLKKRFEAFVLFHNSNTSYETNAEYRYMTAQFFHYLYRNLTSPLELCKENFYHLFYAVDSDTRAEALYALIFTTASWFALSAAFGFGIKVLMGSAIISAASAAIAHAPQSIQAIAHMTATLFKASPSTFLLTMKLSFDLLQNIIRVSSDIIAGKNEGHIKSFVNLKKSVATALHNFSLFKTKTPAGETEALLPNNVNRN